MAEWARYGMGRRGVLTAVMIAVAVIGGWGTAVSAAENAVFASGKDETLADDTRLLQSVAEDGRERGSVSVAYDAAAGTIAAVATSNVTSRPTPGALLDPLQIELYPGGAANNMAGSDHPLLAEFSSWTYTAPGGGTNHLEFTCDTDTGRLLQTTSGTYSYNDAGQLTQITHEGTSSSYTMSYTYDADGQLGKYVYDPGENPVTYTYTYDASGRLEQTRCDRGRTYSYTYDEAGRLISRRETWDLYGGCRERQYSYDDQGALEQIDYYEDGELSGTDTFTYTTWGEVLNARQ